MEAYKEYLCTWIGYLDDLGLRNLTEIEAAIIDDPSYTINRNEKGRIHSRYLGDRYEPAISHNCGYDYYLFDGEIKDCEHPFLIYSKRGVTLLVAYYSSKRIKNEQPIFMDREHEQYNRYKHLGGPFGKILDEYPAKISYDILIKDFSPLCEEMEDTEFEFIN